MKLVKAKLIKVESKPDAKTGLMVHRLIFKDKHFDRGLEEWVPSSLPVKLSPEHHDLLLNYQRLQGQEIAVEVDVTPVDRNVYFRTSGQGIPMILKEVTTAESK
ncbi:hypothetical protein I2F30_13425 [Acinetobacter sp. SCC474]|nr:hypothetical protein [Acinetobacter pollinis]MBF7699333.1 hypothetical protein [Acinetobacter pollinis]